jgi:hypothetical protein
MVCNDSRPWAIPAGHRLVSKYPFSAPGRKNLFVSPIIVIHISISAALPLQFAESAVRDFLTPDKRHSSHILNWDMSFGCFFASSDTRTA